MEENNHETAIDLGRKPQRAAGFVAETYEWTESVVFALAIVVVIFTFIIRPVGVVGQSMENTLKNGDKVVICNLNYKPKQGDIIVLSTRAVDTPIIKRVIAVGGQTVNINYNTGKVYMNGREYDAPIKEKMEQRGDVTLPVKVPKDSVFVMGDNRNNSFDSRYAQIGMVKVKYILGHAMFRILPLNKFGFLH